MMSSVSNLMLIRLTMLHNTQGKLPVGETAIDTVKTYQEILEKPAKFSFSATWGVQPRNATAEIRVMDGCRPRPSPEEREKGEAAEAVDKQRLIVGGWLQVGHIRVKPTIYSIPDPNSEQQQQQQKKKFYGQNTAANDASFLLNLIVEVAKKALIPTAADASRSYLQTVNAILHKVLEFKGVKQRLSTRIKYVPPNLNTSLYPENDSYTPISCSMIVANFILDRLRIKPAAPLFGDGEHMSYLGGYVNDRLIRRKAPEAYCDSVSSLRELDTDTMCDPQELKYCHDLSFLTCYPSQLLAPLSVNSFSGKGSESYHKLDITPIYKQTGDQNFFGSEKINVTQWTTAYKPFRRVLAVPSFSTNLMSPNYEGAYGTREEYLKQYGWSDSTSMLFHTEIAFGSDFTKQCEYIDRRELLIELISDCFFARTYAVCGSQNSKEYLQDQRKAFAQLLFFIHNGKNKRDDEEFLEWFRATRKEEGLEYLSMKTRHLYQMAIDTAKDVAQQGDPMLDHFMTLTEAMMQDDDAYNQAVEEVKRGEWYKSLLANPGFLGAAMDALMAGQSDHNDEEEEESAEKNEVEDLVSSIFDDEEEPQPRKKTKKRKHCKQEEEEEERAEQPRKKNKKKK